MHFEAHDIGDLQCFARLTLKYGTSVQTVSTAMIVSCRG
jgi:hypothetical protein